MKFPILKSSVFYKLVFVIGLLLALLATGFSIYNTLYLSNSNVEIFTILSRIFIPISLLCSFLLMSRKK